MPYHFLLSGSLAYDAILMHEGHFHHKILPEEIARLSVAFGIDHVSEEFGGTGGNIAYNASLLGLSPQLVASIGGKDSDVYLQHLEAHGIATSCLTQITHERMPHAWIMTDQQNNQITGFHKGAMKYPPLIPATTPEVWLLAPYVTETTLHLAELGVSQNKTVLMDPGQNLTNLCQKENLPRFLAALETCKGLFVNEYEALLLCKHIDIESDHFLSNKKFVVITQGAQGARLLTKEGEWQFPCAKPEAVVDPTGCGDAFRAGFLAEYLKGSGYSSCMALGSVMGAFAVSRSGGQNHRPTRQEVHQKLESYLLTLERCTMDV